MTSIAGDQIYQIHDEGSKSNLETGLYRSMSRDRLDEIIQRNLPGKTLDCQSKQDRDSESSVKDEQIRITFDQVSNVITTIITKSLV